tara:strand:+ start:420 stop:776 length:357 start_codon:yes stop_codon:yes gene_type:complete
MKKIFIILSLSFLLLNGCSRITPLKGSQYQKKPFSGYQDCLAKTTGRYNFSELALNLFAGIGGLVMMYKSGKADSFWGFLGSSMLSGAGFDRLDRVRQASEACKDYDEWKKSQRLNVI